MTTSKPSVVPRLTPSKITDEGSAPSLPRTSVAPTRFAQISSCSVAAARNVSPAASKTLFPSATSWAASFPMVVVLPLPLTPMTSNTNGFFFSLTHRRAPAGRGAVERQRRRLEGEELRAALAQEGPDRVGILQVLARERRADLFQQPLAG